LIAPNGPVNENVLFKERARRVRFRFRVGKWEILFLSRKKSYSAMGAKQHSVLYMGQNTSSKFYRGRLLLFSFNFAGGEAMTSPVDSVVCPFTDDLIERFVGLMNSPGGVTHTTILNSPNRFTMLGVARLMIDPAIPHPATFIVRYPPTPLIGDHHDAVRWDPPTIRGYSTA
jgi:hypothetical protein